MKNQIRLSAAFGNDEVVQYAESLGDAIVQLKPALINTPSKLTSVGVSIPPDYQVTVDGSNGFDQAVVTIYEDMLKTALFNSSDPTSLDKEIRSLTGLVVVKQPDGYQRIATLWASLLPSESWALLSITACIETHESKAGYELCYVDENGILMCEFIQQ